MTHVISLFAIFPHGSKRLHLKMCEIDNGNFITMGLSLVAAVAVSVICGSKSKRVAFFEGYDLFQLGEDVALRQLYDSDGERVLGAVIASQAVAESDEKPQQAAAALRSAWANLEAVQHAAGRR